DYYTIPSLETLQKLPAAKLRSVPDLVVGRKGYGQVAFSHPVDLTTLSSVDELLGGLVRLEERNATVYPDEYEASKPPPGEGLNVPATITLERCFPLDKATRKPIRDKAHPRVAQHVKRLRALEGTSFIEYDAETGAWCFEVETF
ncbi:nucleoporin autopeptidase-domain-containing protein, partial [Rhodotorula diobovata]